VKTPPPKGGFHQRGALVEWPAAYLPDVSQERVGAWLAACGAPSETGPKLLETAALCRLAFARLESGTGFVPVGGVAPGESIISQTQTEPTGGRPATTRWAFWTVQMIRDSGLPPAQTRLKSRQLADLVHILTGRQIMADELRGEFGRLRMEANDRASRAARVLLDRPIRAELTDEEFAAFFREGLSTGLEPDTQVLPMVVNGRLNEDWLTRLVRVRRAILRRVEELGVLTGERPMLRLFTISQVVRGMPLGPPPPVKVHLGKALNVQSPTSSKASTVSVSVDLATPPYGVALCALPQWWVEWEAALHLPMEWQAVSEETRGGQNPRSKGEA
jgi:hypothetical protein